MLRRKLIALNAYIRKEHKAKLTSIAETFSKMHNLEIILHVVSDFFQI
jgi:hypothetical protein